MCWVVETDASSIAGFPMHGEPISIHGEPDRDDYWTDLEREQFESNAERVGREGTKMASWSRRI